MTAPGPTYPGPLFDDVVSLAALGDRARVLEIGCGTGKATLDAIVAFTAFHWIDPELRYEKSAALLRDGGALAVVATKHVLSPDGDPFFAEEDDGRPRRPEEVADLSDEILASGFFADVAVCRHLWDVVYTADGYVAVLTPIRSSARSGRPPAKSSMRGCAGGSREGCREGTVRKTYLATLNVARRSPTRAHAR